MIMDTEQRFDDEILVGHAHSRSHHMKILVVDADVFVDVTEKYGQSIRRSPASNGDLLEIICYLIPHRRVGDSIWLAPERLNLPCKLHSVEIEGQCTPKTLLIVVHKIDNHCGDVGKARLVEFLACLLPHLHRVGKISRCRYEVVKLKHAFDANVITSLGISTQVCELIDLDGFDSDVQKGG